MRLISLSLTAVAAMFFSGCSYEPSGRWEATQQVEVLRQKGDLMTVAFNLSANDVCALSDKWHYEKEMRYKEVLCQKGRGWITDDEHFKKLSD